MKSIIDWTVSVSAKPRAEVLAMYMLEGWAREAGWSSAAIAASYMPSAAVPRVTREFLASAQALHTLLGPGDQCGPWTPAEVLDTLCRQFGAWVAWHEAKHGWPGEPVQRFWMQGAVVRKSIEQHSVCSLAMPYIAAFMFLLKADSYDDATAEGVRLLVEGAAQAGPAQATRYWILQCRSPLNDDGRWIVRAMVELTADTRADVTGWTYRLGETQFGEYGTDWQLDAPEGVIASQGSFGQVRAAEPSGPCPPAVQLLHPCGSLPLRFR